MNLYKSLIISILALFVFTSCEDVIELDLDNVEPRIIIESTLDITSGAATAALTKTNDFYDLSQPEGISGAVIILKNKNGDSYPLSEKGNGIYEAENVSSSPGQTFTLEVETEGILYSATSKAPSFVVLDSIGQQVNSIPFGDNDFIQLFPEWNDPAGVENFYRLRPIVNDTLMADVYALINDDLTDGKTQRVPLRAMFEEGDLVQMQLLSCDENYYRYFFDLSATIGDGPNGATPFNPTTNFDNDALGYFGVISVSEVEVQL